MIPKDPVMLLSYVNTQLRDHYSSLDDLCRSLDLDPQQIISSLAAIQYQYDADRNQFV
ncbi:MAG TPA: DUF4250 domain-containing protein [Candidatus Caccovicinus merdipullorum]|uniref:DUF4250 domain-containing protein n=1 Tax=Candidatus Caccovicinus merdipullorum TaxID=2840724 RepID=A0A9D1KGD1_9FIRM|nr:DUF4250 domain-containing protein [Candidatus Caccovicinus merdipullorum]